MTVKILSPGRSWYASILSQFQAKPGAFVLDETQSLKRRYTFVCCLDPFTALSILRTGYAGPIFEIIISLVQPTVLVLDSSFSVQEVEQDILISLFDLVGVPERHEGIEVFDWLVRGDLVPGA